MQYENIQVGYNTETQQPIFEKREVKRSSNTTPYDDIYSGHVFSHQAIQKRIHNII